MKKTKAISFDEDIRLMLKTQKGNKKAYDRLYRKYLSVIRSFLVSLGAKTDISEDLAQEVFIRVWENKEKYLPVAKVKTFLFAYARNIFNEHISKQKKQNIIFNTEDMIFQLNTYFENTYEDEHDFTDRLQDLINQLSEKQKQICSLVYLGGVAPKEAAKHLGCSIESVHQNLYYARQNLQKLSIEPDKLTEFGG